MSFSKLLAHTAKNQALNVMKMVGGRPISLPSLTSMTLDDDDVEVALAYLKNERASDHETVNTYETRFAEWNGSKHAFAFMSGRVALSACISALDLLPEDEVIVPGYTCVVVPNAFHFAGIRVTFSDIELDTFGLDITKLEANITSKTKAILLQHLYGLVSRDYEQIVNFAKERGLAVIEDCAHATGATFRGEKVGNRGHIAFFSSERSKVFNTIQGGMATTNDPQLASRLQDYYLRAPYPTAKFVNKQLYNVVIDYSRYKHPQRWWRSDLVNVLHKDKFILSTTLEEEKGIRPAHYGQKMPPAIAALGLNQLGKIETYNQRRRETAARWDNWCHTHGYQKPLVIPDSSPVFLRYPVLVEPQKKQDLTWALDELGVKPGVWFVSHVHPVDRLVDNCPAASEAIERCINFPSLLGEA